MTYLGHKLNSSQKTKIFWRPLVKKVKLKLSLWKERILNKMGRIVLLKSSINSLPLYWMNLAKIPKGVVNEIDLLRRRFFWKENAKGGAQIRKMHSVNWRVIRQPKDHGGLALQSLHDRNVILLAKWLWKLKKDRVSLCSRVLIEKYGEDLIDSIYSGTLRLCSLHLNGMLLGWMEWSFRAEWIINLFGWANRMEWVIQVHSFWAKKNNNSFLWKHAVQSHSLVKLKCPRRSTLCPSPRRLFSPDAISLSE